MQRKILGNARDFGHAVHANAFALSLHRLLGVEANRRAELNLAQLWRKRHRREA